MADSPVLYVYYRPDNDDAYPGVPARHITEADWAVFSPSQRRIVQEATTQDGYGRRKVWVHIDLVDETEQERAEREAREQAAREAYERGQSIVRWRDIEPLVSGVNVSRIIASADPNHPLEDGDLLVLIDAPSFFTDFSGYTAGQAPGDWSLPWASASLTYTVEEDAEATGGKLLRSVKAQGTRTPLVWGATAEAAASHADAEIVYKWRTTSTTAQVRAILRGSGNAGSESGYMAGHRSDSDTTFGIYTDGAYAVLAPDGGFGAIPVMADTWYISRFRIAGSALRQKTWLAADAEPSTWMNVASDVTFTEPGFAAIFPFQISTVDFDWVGFAFGGGSAPTGED